MKNTVTAMFEPCFRLCFSILVPLAIANDRVKQGSQDVVEVTVPVEIVLNVVEVEDGDEVVVKIEE